MRLPRVSPSSEKASSKNAAYCTSQCRSRGEPTSRDEVFEAQRPFHNSRPARSPAFDSTSETMAERLRGERIPHERAGAECISSRLMIRVSHVITGLGVGGAEMMLVKLLSGLDQKQFRSHVISLSADLALAPAIRDMEIPIDVIDVPPYAASVLPAVVRMRRLLRAAQPDLVQTWLYHADLAGGLAAKWLKLPVIWNVQTSTVDPKGISRRTIRVVNLCAKTSGFIPDTIVSCSQAAVAIHTALGYRDKFRVIPNGTDVGIFRPDEEARRAVRAELNVDDATPVIGMAARFHAQKDHPNFLAAAADLVRTHPRVRFALCGLGLQPDNAELMSLVRGHGLQDHVLLMG